MAVQPVTQSNSGYTPSKTPDQIDNPNASMGKLDFLQMLVTKLKYQDPTSPVDDANFTAEMAQFSTLEQTQNLNASATAQATALNNLNTNIIGLMAMQNTTQAAGLIGKTVVIATTTVDSTGASVASTATGAVSVVKFVDGQPKVVVNGVEYSLSDITEIRA